MIGASDFEFTLEKPEVDLDADFYGLTAPSPSLTKEDIAVLLEELTGTSRERVSKDA